MPASKRTVSTLLAIWTLGSLGLLHAQEPLIPAYAEPKVSWMKKEEPKQNDAKIYESEDVLVNKEIVTENQKIEPKKWSFFLEGDKKWSGDKTLRGNIIKEDRNPLDPESAVLKFRIPLEKGLTYKIQIKGGRTYGVSFDGKEFKKKSGLSTLVERFEAKDDFIEFYVSNCYVDPNPGFTYVDYFTVAKAPTYAPIAKPAPNPVFNGFAKTRVVEKFERSVTAIPMKDGGVFVNWRFLKEDPKDAKFDVFRIRDRKETKLNSEPIEQTCDFTDADGKIGDRYAVRPAAGTKAVAGEASTEAWKLDESSTPYQSIKLHDSKATVQKVGVGDLNGDGVYDYVVKTPNTNIDPWDRVWKPSTETYKISAYLSDGTYLWTRDMGWNIETGMWYSPFIVFDFNGDGKAEVAIKTADGGDFRDKDGRVYDGPEYLVVLDGMTGKEIARAPWPSRDGFESYNLVSRNQLSLGYLDGKTPCVIAMRGTYGTMKAEAWQLKDGKLESCWKFSNYETAYDEHNKQGAGVPRSDSTPKYYGQGAHQSIAADLDGDGRDEVLLGSIVLNGNGDVYWSNGKGHPDWMILTDIIWENPGLELAYIYETAQPKGGVCVADAKTGKLLWENNESSKHVHTGHCVNFDPTMSGPEVLGIDHNGHMPIDGKYWRFTNTGKLLSNNQDESGRAQKGVYWDADLEKEILKNTIADYRGGDLTKIRGSVAMAADLFGDWREEVLTTLPGELRVYSTTIPAMDRRTALMQEHQYRTKVAINSQAYYYDADLPYMPTFESNNLSLIFKPTTSSCQVTISASMHAPLSGTVTLTAPNGITLDNASWNVNLKPGEIAVKQVRISGDIPSVPVQIRGELKENGSNKIYRGQVPVYAQAKAQQASANAISLPATKYSSSEGGSVLVIKGRPIAKDGCMAGWDFKGHKISWKMSVKKAGNYRLLLYYANLYDTKRRLSINGKTIGEFSFAGTGGKGESADEWKLSPVSTKGKAVLLELKAGENVIMMENIDNNMMNLAYIYLEPA